MSLDGLHEVLACDDSFPLVGVLALAAVVGQHRGLGLLGLQEQWFLVVSGVEQQDPGTGADTPDADHLARHVDQRELLDQVPAVGLEGLRVRVQEVVELGIERVAVGVGEQLFDGHDQGWVAGDPALSVHDGGELAERLQAVSGACLRHRLLGQLPAALGELGLELGDGLLDFEVGVPDVEQRHPGELPHRGAVALDAGEDDRCGSSWSVKPLSRPATTRLAARRLTSHSKGPGSVSSKSLTSNTSRRPGEAKPPKFAR